MPDAQNDAFVTNELNTVSGNLFSDNGSGVDVDPVAIAAVNGEAINVGNQITLASGALLTVNADGTFSYDPNGAFEQTPPEYSGASNTTSIDSFTYTLAGGDTATVTLTINGVDNDDRIVLGTGNVHAGTGTDTLVLPGARADYTIEPWGGYYLRVTNIIDNSYHLVLDVEVFEFSDQTVAITDLGPFTTTGTPGWDYLYGSYAEDQLFGGDGDDQLDGGYRGNDLLDGGDGADRLIGGEGSDTLIGGSGDDRLYADAGDFHFHDDLWNLRDDSAPDFLDGGEGFDTAYLRLDNSSDIVADFSDASVEQTLGDGTTVVNVEQFRIQLGAGTNSIVLGAGDDQVFGGYVNGPGNDTIDGGGGNDNLYGYGGNDIIYGGDGNDGLGGGEGDDQLFGGDGDDYLSPDAGIDTVDGGAGNDMVTLNFTGGPAASFSLATDTVAVTANGTTTLANIEGATIYGSEFDDDFTGGTMGEYINANAGNDTVHGGEGNDSLEGGAGDDYLYGDDGDDQIDGSTSNTGYDFIDGGSGVDRTTLFFYGQPAGVNFALDSNPTLTTDYGIKTLTSIEGAYVSATQFGDDITGGEGADNFHGNNGNDVLSGLGGNDSLYGDGGNDSLLGGDGDDYLEGGAGTNTLDGGAGNDRTVVSFYLSGTGVTFAFAPDMTFTDSVGTTTLTNVESAFIRGSDHADTITGGSGNDEIVGWIGDDVLSGGDGNDTLVNSYGNATLDGGAGNDVLWVHGAGASTMTGGAGNDSLNGVTNSIITAVYSGPRSNYQLQDNGDGTVTITDLSGADGTDTLRSVSNLQFSDGSFALADLMAADEPADAQDDEFTTDELTAVNGSVFDDNGSGADSDPDGPALSVAEVNGEAANVGSQITLSSGALLTVNSDGTFSYDPNGAFQYTPTTGSGAFNTPSADSFSYTLSGGDTATVVVTINGVDNDDTVVGSEDGNRLISGTGNDIVFGLGGADYITGGFGDDMIFGDDGVDRAGWYQTNEALGGTTVSLLLQGTPQDTGAQGWDTLFDIENLSGTPFADSLTGDDNDNWLWGSAATIDLNWISGSNNDFLDGQGGNDLLVVGIGNHVVIGGSGTDTLRFTENGSPEPDITVDLNLQGGAQDTGAGSWTLSEIENVSSGIGNDAITGDGNSNLLAGNLGDDILNGGGGEDLLLGDGFVNVDSGQVSTITYDQGTFGGNDQLNGGGGDDILYGGAGADTLSGNADNDTLHGGEDNDFLIGGGGGDTLNGDGGQDTLTSGDGNDAAYGGAGDDLIRGNFGDDLIDGGDGYDRAGYYHTDETIGGVTVDLNIAGAQDTGSQGWDTLVSIEYLSGTPFADVLVGDSNDNVLWGSMAIIDPGSGLVSTTNDDVLDGGDGDDLLYVGIGNHSLTGGDGIDSLGFLENGGDDPVIRVSLTLQGIAQDTGQGLWTLNGIENLSGGNDDDELTGDASVNILAGSFGNDLLTGSGGDDSLYGDGAIDTGAPTSGPATLFPDIGANGSDVLDGGDGNDALYGGGGNDQLLGGSGNDLLDGGDGQDLANYGPETGFGPVTVDLSAGTATGGGGTDTLVGIEDVLGTGNDDLLIGDGVYNVLNGGGGNDTLDGAGGDDTLMGGDGNDQLYGNTGNDQLIGGLGDDVLDGGADRDVADYQYATGGVTAVLYGGGFGETIGVDGYDQMYNIEDLNGSAFNDILYGDEANNMVVGNDGHDDVRGGGGDDNILAGAGDDLLYGNGGNDYLDGGDGYDRVGYYSGATAGVTVDLNLQGVQQDTGQGWDVLVNIENVSGTQFGDTLTGDGGDNVLWGSAATLNGVVSTENNDTLSGGGGNDLLIAGIGNHVIDGGDGTDTFRFTENGVPETGITLSLLLAGQAQASGNGSWTLTGIENLSGGIGGDMLTGDDNANVLAGDLGDDILSGGAGDDTLYGDGQIMWDDHGTGRSGPAITTADATSEYVGGVSGNDTLEGGLGDDIIDGGGGSDTASYANAAGGVEAFLYRLGNGNGESAGADGFDLLSNIENLTGSAFNDQLGGNNLANIIEGGEGNDGLRGNDGDDTLLGGGGNDFLNGGLGNDIIDGGAGYDRAAFYEDAGPGGVTVDLNLQGVAQDTGQGMDTLIGIENVSGSIYGDTLTGDDGDNQLWGSASTLSNGTIVTTNNDTLSGGGGNDLLVVGIGDHVVDGGSGTDTFRFTENGAPETGITLSLLLAGQAQASGNGSWTLTGIENLSGSSADDDLSGDDGANVLAGDSGNDALSGGGGNDTLYGDGAIMVNAPGSGPIETIIDVATIGGFNGDDVLDGGAGDDQLYGGGGSDTASYATATGNVIALLYGGGSGEADGAAGYDQLHDIENLTGSAFDDILYGNGEVNVVDGGDGHDDVRGGGGDDQVYGGDGNDLLYGNAGDDYLDGGSGYDRVGYYSGATAGVTVDLRLQGTAQDTGQGWDTLVGIENVSGTVFADTLIGDEGDNVLWGSASTIAPGNVASGNNDTLAGEGGNDLLIAGIGDHTIDGGSGTDTFRFSENSTALSGLTLSLMLQGGAQTSGSGNWTLTGIENLSGTAAADSLTGDGNANVLAGDLGDDTLVGGDGNDTLYGDGQINWDTSPAGRSGPIVTTVDATGLYVGGVPGNDLLEGGLGNDLIDGGGGTDTASYEHASGGVTVDLGGGFSDGADGNDTLLNIENVTGSDFADDLTGDGGANIIDGRAGNDFISGGAGNDVLYGGDGNDFVQGDFGENDISVTGNDILYGGNGDDSLRGGMGDDQLYGGTGNDLLRGNGGVDYFDGGADDGEGLNGIGDRVSFYERRATQGVVADLRTGVISNDGFGNVETMVGIESLGAGTAFADTFYGNDSRNYLAADVGDQAYGFGGDDIFQATSAPAIIDGGTGTDRLSLFIASGLLLVDGNGDGLAELGAAATSGFIVNLTTGTITDGYGNSGSVTGIENVDGTSLSDALSGDGNVNVLNGGDGNDTLEGRGGNDTIDGGNGIDTASYANATGAVTVTLFNNLTGNGTASGADGDDTLISIENVIGSAFNDSITGSAGDNILHGGAGNDFLQARGGNDSLYGGDGNDYVGGGTGDDLLDGGDGWDRASFSNGASGPVTVDLRIQGIAQNTGLGMDTLVGIENLTGSIFGDTLTGDDGSNWLWGGTDEAGVSDTIDGQGGNDLIENGVGNHNLSGGAGIDTFSFNPFTVPTNATISLALQGAAQDTGAGIMTLNGFENLSGSSFSDTLIGDGNDNILAGGELGDTLAGGAGNDSLYGDGFFGTSSSPSGQITLFTDVGTLGGISGDDTLEGGLGNDIIDGGGGADTASYANASGAVTVTLTAGGAGTSSGADGSDTLVSIENLFGGAFNDNLTGDGSANQLDGGGGSDYIIGGLGDDTVIGGSGVDRAGYYQTSAALGGVTVSLLLQGAAQNTGSQGFDTLSGIENLSGTPFGDVLTGDDANNWLWGSSATISPGNVSTTNNDTLDGQGGHDLLMVGKGNHTLVGGTGNDTIRFTENGGAEANLVVSLATAAAQNTGNGTWTLSGVENLSGGLGNDTLTGDGNANILAGDGGRDTLNGGAGNDTLFGDGLITVDGLGITTIYGDGAATAGVDTLNGGDGDDFLYGGGGNDMLKGDKDNDTLYGGTGNDTLVGGQGNDRYVIEANSGADTISGFTHVDRIVFDTSSGVTSFSQLTLTAVGGTNTLVTWGNGNSILISGLRPRDMVATDFQFTSAAGFEHAPQDFAANYSVPHDMFL